MYAAKDIRRKGYRKFGERYEGKIKVLVYRHRSWGKGRVTHDVFADIYPDGSIKERHSVLPRIVG
jgi:hypothetical protein